MLQDLPYFAQSPYHMLLPLPLVVIAWNFFFFLADRHRAKSLAECGGKSDRGRLWQRAAEMAESDLLVIAISMAIGRRSFDTYNLEWYMMIVVWMQCLSGLRYVLALSNSLLVLWPYVCFTMGICHAKQWKGP